ncbi:MAG: flagellar basal body P-ring formation protein FlgA [Sedimentisphaerales bacterium]|nr:flagellar basal body P-ring formation protein FlgA [Sedimentisphaerales bacterium]
MTIIIPAILLSASSAGGQMCRIRVKSNVDMESGPVRLGDIAEVITEDSQVKERVEQLSVFEPSEGITEIELGLFEISRALARGDINPVTVDIYGANVCRLSLPEVTETEKPSIHEIIDTPVNKEPSARTLATVLQQRISQSTGLESARLCITWDPQDQEYLQQPYEEKRFEIKYLRHISLGPLNFEIKDNDFSSVSENDAITNEGNKSRRRVSGRVEYLCERLVAAQPLPTGHKISAADVKIIPARIDSMKDLSTEDLESILGKEVVRPIAVNQPIRAELLRKLLLVKRRDPVKVVSRSGCINISLTGVALEDGSKGDIISVSSNSDRTKIIQARVTGVNMVSAITYPEEVHAGDVSSVPVAKAEDSNISLTRM